MIAPVRSYKRRASRVTASQRDALDRLWPRWGVAVDGMPLDLAALFGRTAPVVLEIGFGMGEATVEIAASSPEVDVLAIDVHTPGQGSLLRALEEAELPHVRVADGDAVELLTCMIAPSSLAGVRLFFPDPWPKTRHHKRRLLDPAFVELVTDRLAVDGVLHLATDITSYLRQAERVLADHPRLRPTPAPWRAVTRFERQGLAAGRPGHDLAVRKVS